MLDSSSSLDYDKLIYLTLCYIIITLGKIGIGNAVLDAMLVRASHDPLGEHPAHVHCKGYVFKRLGGAKCLGPSKNHVRPYLSPTKQNFPSYSLSQYCPRKLRPPLVA